MNTQRMLNVFIIIFLVINIGLYFYIENLNKDRYTLSAERYQLLNEVLTANNIELEATLPENYSRPRLVISAPSDIEQDLLDRMFGEETRESTYKEERHVHETVSGRLTFDNSQDGLIYYGANRVKYKPIVNDEASYNVLVKRFVSDFTLDRAEFVLTDTRALAGEEAIIYYFNEIMDGEILFCNEVLVKLVKGIGITEARTVRYEPYAFKETANPLHPVDEVIYNFMVEIEDATGAKRGITDIKIGYFLRLDNRNDLVNQTIEPYYRIKLRSGESHYINAYTNEVYK